MEIFRSITPLVEPLSLDEAFLDVSGAVRRLGRPAEIGQLIRDRVADEQGITCSVGRRAAPSSSPSSPRPAASPTGCSSCPAAGVVAFLHPLPVGALWGVGEKTEKELTRLGLHTVGDIAHTPAHTLVRALGQATGAHLHALSWGRDERSVVPHEPDKSIGAEETFARDVDDPEVVRRELLRLCRAHRRPAADGRAGRAHRQRSRCGSPTSRRSPAPAPCARPPTSAASSTPPRASCTRPSASTGPGCGWSASGSRVCVESETAPRQLLLGERGHGRREAEQAADRAGQPVRSRAWSGRPAWSTRDAVPSPVAT